MIVTRREAILGGVAGATLAATPALGATSLPSKRPAVGARRFTSRSIHT